MITVKRHQMIAIDQQATTNMMYKSLPLAFACILAGCRAQVINLPVLVETQNLRNQISICVGQLVCGVTQLPQTTTVQCVNADFVCDGTSQCANGADEHDCQRMCEGKVMCPDRKTCAIPCDGVMSCAGGEDEMNCLRTCMKPEVLCDDQATCATVCDGSTECPNGGLDEMGCSPTCPAGQMLCADGTTCATPCDRMDQCDGAGDELNCPFQCRCMRGQYICLASNKCLDRQFVCQLDLMPDPKDTDTTPDEEAKSCFAGGGNGDDEAFVNQYGTVCFEN